MSNKYEEGIAFILEGDTEKEFYLSLLEFLCKKHGDIIFVIVQIITQKYSPRTHIFMLFFTLSNEPAVGMWHLGNGIYCVKFKQQRAFGRSQRINYIWAITTIKLPFKDTTMLFTKKFQ